MKATSPTHCLLARLRSALRAAALSGLVLAIPASSTPAQAAEIQTAEVPPAPDDVALGLRARPASARPGELVEVEVVAEGLVEASARLGKHEVPLFPAGLGLFRGYTAIPVDAEAALPLLATGKTRGGKRLERQGEVAVPATTFTEHTLRVAKRFTHPSKEQKAKIKADQAAFRKAQQVPFGPPLFTSNFGAPREPVVLNSLYGERRTFNGKLQSRHMGLDLDGRTGDPIHASNDGVVRMVRSCFASGDTVLISHGAGLFTGYFHLSKFHVKVGQKVHKGQLIGLMGATGRVTGPHLHFNAKVNDVTFDPGSLMSFDFFPESVTGPVVMPAKATQP